MIRVYNIKNPFIGFGDSVCAWRRRRARQKVKCCFAIVATAAVIDDDDDDDEQTFIACHIVQVPSLGDFQLHPNIRCNSAAAVSLPDSVAREHMD